MDAFIHQAGLAHPGLPDDGHDLTVPGLGAGQGVLECLDLYLAPDEAGESARCGCL